MRKTLNTIINVIIIVALLQAFFEEFAVIAISANPEAFWNMNTKFNIVFAGMIIDIIFSIEFIVRFIDALKKGRLKTYFIEENGWVDLLASIPILLLYSAPRVWVLSHSVSHFELAKMLQVVRLLKSIKLLRFIRMIRSIRLLRAARLLKMANRDAETGRRVNLAATCAVSAVIIGVIFSAVFFRVMRIPGPEVYAEKRNEFFLNEISKSLKQGDTSEEMNRHFAGVIDPKTGMRRGGLRYFVSLFVDRRLVVKKYDISIVRQIVDTESIDIIEAAVKVKDKTREVVCIFLTNDVNKQLARQNIMLQLVIIFVFSSFVLIYQKFEDAGH